MVRRAFSLRVVAGRLETARANAAEIFFFTVIGVLSAKKYCDCRLDFVAERRTHEERRLAMPHDRNTSKVGRSLQSRFRESNCSASRRVRYDSSQLATMLVYCLRCGCEFGEMQRLLRVLRSVRLFHVRCGDTSTMTLCAPCQRTERVRAGISVFASNSPARCWRLPVLADNCHVAKEFST